MKITSRLGVIVGLLAGAAGVLAQGSMAPDLRSKVDAAVAEVMARTSVPSASVGIVQGGTIVFTKAYGRARIDPPLAATAEMAYPIGSISKQFTSAALLLLQQDGRLSIDDPVAKYFPELTRAKDVTIRNLLTHTSGYEDYAPQDYTIPDWMKPTTADAVIHTWATKPLDFEPGTQYQYSNTNYNIAGLIVEKASGEKFWPYLTRRVLKPLGLSRTIDLDTERSKLEVTGYMRNALGPLRPAILEAPGWYFADGEMAMPVGDLLTWDISLINQSLLAPASYAAMQADMKLKNGQVSRYGLGVGLSTRDGHRVVSHGGEVGGYVSQNMVFPDDKIAIAVLTNQEASTAAAGIARAIAALLLPPTTAPAGPAADAAKAEAQAKQIISGLQQGKIDRSLFTANCNFYFDATAIGDFQTSLGPLGSVQTVTQTGTNLRGGMTFRAFDIAFASGTKVRLTTYTTADGKLEQFLIDAIG
jgi:CubicO group peptidase (beta-lactamase class C family)